MERIDWVWQLFRNVFRQCSFLKQRSTIHTRITRGGEAGRSLTSSGSHTVIWHRSYSPNPSKNSSNPNEPTCQFQKIGFRGAVWAAIQRRWRSHDRIVMLQVLEFRQRSYLTHPGRENPILRLYPVPFCPNSLWFSALLLLLLLLLLPTWLLFKRVNFSESRPSAGKKLMDRNPFPCWVRDIGPSQGVNFGPRNDRI